MVFSSIIFLYMFFPLSIVLYFLNKNIEYKNIILCFISVLFYAWGEPVYVILLLCSAFFNYVCGIYIEKLDRTKKASILLAATVAVNLILLGIFKYTNFFIYNINILTHLNIQNVSVKLPIGISFYTFQTVSYIVDVYRHDIKSQKSFINFLLYVSLFPQLIAGPIVRYSEIEAQINSRETTIDSLYIGIKRFIIGLAKKVIIANTAGSIAAPILDKIGPQTSVLGAWVGIIMFTVQIYFDFSGYSDMAIGLGKMFGFTYNENFNYPYISKSITEFWRRWHISLSSFFRDYLYIPLGGNRKHQIRNLLIVWFLTGLWHGASYNFILWGLYYCMFLILEKFVINKYIDKVPSAIRHFITMFIVVIGWALFYYTDMRLLGTFLATAFGFNKNVLYDIEALILLKNNFIFIIISIIFCTPLSRLKNQLLGLKEHKIIYIMSVGASLVLMIVITSLLVKESYNPFLYFRF